MKHFLTFFLTSTYFTTESQKWLHKTVLKRADKMGCDIIFVRLLCLDSSDISWVNNAHNIYSEAAPIYIYI